MNTINISCQKCHLSVVADTQVFGQLLGPLGLNNPRNDRGNIDLNSCHT